MTSFRRVWLSPKKNRRFFYQNSGGVPTGEKTRRNEENTPKRRLSEVGHESFFLRKFRFSCPFGVKKAAIPRPGNVYTRGVHGVAYELLSRNPKSGYFVFNFDTKNSVKLGYSKIDFKNPLIFPISRLFSSEPETASLKVGFFEKYTGDIDEYNPEETFGPASKCVVYSQDIMFLKNEQLPVDCEPDPEVGTDEK